MAGFPCTSHVLRGPRMKRLSKKQATGEGRCEMRVRRRSSCAMCGLWREDDGDRLLSLSLPAAQVVRSVGPSVDDPKSFFLSPLRKCSNAAAFDFPRLRPSTGNERSGGRGRSDCRPRSLYENVHHDGQKFP